MLFFFADITDKINYLRVGRIKFIYIYNNRGYALYVSVISYF